MLSGWGRRRRHQTEVWKGGWRHGATSNERGREAGVVDGHENREMGKIEGSSRNGTTETGAMPETEGRLTTRTEWR